MRKKSSNKKNHGRSFTEAQTVFTDEKGLLLDDPDHSHDEDRFILPCLNSDFRILVVSHTHRKYNQDNKDYFRP